MNPILAAAFALQAAGSGASEEMTFFDHLRQGRFSELSAWVEKLPAGHPLESARPWVARLSATQKSLIDAINRGGTDCDLRDVHPDSPRSGKIVAATATTLTVRDGERKRTLIWSGLPPGVSYQLVRRFLPGEAEKDGALLQELADALGLADELRGLNKVWADDVATVEAIRAKLRERSLEEAKRALQARPGGESHSASLKVAELWVRRLEQAVLALAARKAVAAGQLPEGSTLFLYDDFEGGPELFPKSWVKGSLSARPDGPVPVDRWCLLSAFAGVQEAYGELVAHFELGGKEDSALVLEEGTSLSCRIWASNTRMVSVVMQAGSGDQSDRVSRIDVPIRPERWTPVRIRLGDVTRHRLRVAYADVVLPVALGDRIHALRFEANRENADRKDGYFYLDDLEVYSVKPGPARAADPK